VTTRAKQIISSLRQGGPLTKSLAKDLEKVFSEKVEALMDLSEMEDRELDPLAEDFPDGTLPLVSPGSVPTSHGFKANIIVDSAGIKIFPEEPSKQRFELNNTRRIETQSEARSLVKTLDIPLNYNKLIKEQGFEILFY